jgi:hypothetical protein
MIVKRPLQITRTAVMRAELREQLIELWAHLFERKLRFDLDAGAESSGETHGLRAIERVEPRDLDAENDHVGG